MNSIRPSLGQSSDDYRAAKLRQMDLERVVSLAALGDPTSLLHALRERTFACEEILELPDRIEGFALTSAEAKDIARALMARDAALAAAKEIVDDEPRLTKGSKP